MLCHVIIWVQRKWFWWCKTILFDFFVEWICNRIEKTPRQCTFARQGVIELLQFAFAAELLSSPTEQYTQWERINTRRTDAPT